MTRALRIVLMMVWLVGCSREHSEPPSTEPASSVREPDGIEPLPSATRSDLPEAQPAITITVGERRFTVSNRALVATWPAAVRDAVGQTRPLGDAAYPVVEREVDDATIGLIVPRLHDAMMEVLAVETAHASIVHAVGPTSAFAIRAASDVSFGRVLAAIYAAALSGFNAPRLVLANAAGERELRLVGARVDRQPSALGAALASATGIDSGIRPLGARFVVTLDARGLGVQRADAAPEIIPSERLTPAAIDAAFSGLDGPGEIVFRAPRTTHYAEVVTVLETLVAHGSVSLGAMID